MRHFFSSLRVRLILLVLLAALPSLALIIYIGLEQGQTAKTVLQGEALDMTKHVAYEQAQRIESGRQLLVALAQLRETHQPDDPACSALFADLLKRLPAIYTNVSVAQLNGDVVCGAILPTQRTNMSDREYFQRVLQTQEFQVADYLISRATGKAVLTLAYPVMDNAGQLKGVLVTGIDLSWLSNTLGKSQMPAGSTLTVIDRNGNILARYPEPENYVGKSALDVPLVHAILERKTPGTLEARGLDDAERLYSFSPVYITNQSNPDVYVFSGNVPSAIYADANRGLTRNLIALGIVAILALAAAWFGSDSMFLRRTNVLLEATRRMAQGDLTARAGISRGASELDQLANNFDKMADSLEQRETQLRASEERYRTLAEASQDMIFVVNHDETLQYVNTTVARAFERDAQDLIGKPFAELFPPSIVEMQAAELQKAFSAGEPITSELKVAFPFGDLWLNTCLVPLRDAAGNVKAILGVSRDITARKQTEEQILKRNIELATLYTIGRATIQSLDLDAVLANALTLTLEALGVESGGIYVLEPGAELLTLRAHRGLSDEYVRSVEQIKLGTGVSGKAVVEKKPVVLDLADYPNQQLAPLLARENLKTLASIPLVSAGQAVGALNLATPGVRAFPPDELELLTAIGQLLGTAVQNAQLYQAVQRELAERKRMEEVLIQSEQRLSLHVKQTPLAVIEWDRNFQVIKWNPAAERIFGYTESEALGRHAADLIVPSDARARVDQVWQNLIEQGGERSTNENFTKDGRTILCEWYNSPLVTSDAQTIGVASLVQDITERRRAEQELAKRADDLARSNAELEQFAYVASHDLQEPLRKIQAFGDRLKVKYLGALDEQGRDYLERTINAAGRMSTMINDLLTFSRVTMKGQPFAPVDLARVAREVVAALEIRIEQAGGRVEIGGLPTIDADPLQMHSLLQNLIANGLKFHREGVPPLVKVAASRAAKQVEIRIEDNGIGFDEKHLDRIFQPFQRLHGRGEYEGTGIGLAICRKIAERHGGSITAKTQPGQGATFIVTLPVQQAKIGGAK